MRKKQQNQPLPTPPPISTPDQTFKFLSYYFDKRSLTATFCYQGLDNFIFTERVTFAPNPDPDIEFNFKNDPKLNSLLDRALFLSFIAIGTFYYKAHPTPYIKLNTPIDEFQAKFFNKIYQEGLSQLAFENQLTRAHLAQFHPSDQPPSIEPIPYKGEGILSLQSGGKDSILTATMLNEQEIVFTPWYLSESLDHAHPLVIDDLGTEYTQNRPASIAVRQPDLYHIQQAGGFDGHIPATIVNEALGLVQAILLNKNIVLTSIAQEATEPIAYIGDLAVNHQWSKTWEAEKLVSEYVRRYLSPDLLVGSPIRHLSELRVTEQFVKKCWARYGYSFSSCQVDAYRQFTNGAGLPWCGNCARCANAFLLFCPFLPPASLNSLFADHDLFARESLHPFFMGLLGIDNQLKPFESVGSVNELRTAYASRLDGYTPLPFNVPPGNFDYRATYPVQPEIVNLFKQSS